MSSPAHFTADSDPFSRRAAAARPACAPVTAPATASAADEDVAPDYLLGTVHGVMAAGCALLALASAFITVWRGSLAAGVATLLAACLFALVVVEIRRLTRRERLWLAASAAPDDVSGG